MTTLPKLSLFDRAMRDRFPALTPTRCIRASGEHLEATNDDRGDLTAEHLAEIDREFAIPHSPMVDLARNAVLPPQHLIAREREGGWGADGRAQMVCSCGWRGPWRHEWSDTMCTDLISDERAHRGVL